MYSIFKPSDWLHRLGRAGLASLFVLGGLNKLLGFAATAQRMAEAGLPAADLLLVAVIALELGAGTLVVLGPHLVASDLFSGGCFALAAFTIATNAVFHRFWVLEEPLAALEMSLFFKNVAIAGALTALGSAAWRSHRYPDDVL